MTVLIIIFFFVLPLLVLQISSQVLANVITEYKTRYR